jgi:hypothetical protein
MDPASSSQPGLGEEPTRIAHGVIFAPLIESHPDRIVVGSRTIFLRDGKTCTYALGTNLEVSYTERNGRAETERITVVKPAR